MRAFKRIWLFFMAQFGKLGRLLWKADPIAMYQAEVDRAADEIKEGENGLAEWRGYVERLTRQVEGGENQQRKLKGRIERYLQDGNRDKAQQYAVQLNNVTKELKENQEQLAAYEKKYEVQLVKLKAARERIVKAKEAAKKHKANLDMSRAEASAAELSSKFNTKTGGLDGLSEIENEIQSQIDSNRGKARVVNDLAADDLLDLEEEEKMEQEEANSILAQIESEMGSK